VGENRSGSAGTQVTFNFFINILCVILAMAYC
jgi:hypothetical protein